MPKARITVIAWVGIVAGSACSPHVSSATTCMAGMSRCDQNSYERCSDDGSAWETIDNCAAEGEICILNTGCRACNPGTRSCDTDGFTIVACRADGSGTDAVATCDPNMTQLCEGGMCEDACTFATTSRSYSGCDYWAVDLDNAVTSDEGAAAAQQYAVVVSNPLEVPADVTVTVNDAPQGQPIQERVVATVHLQRVVGGGDLATIDLPSRQVDGSSDPRLNDGPGTWVSSNAYHITSTAPIVAYQFNPLSNVQVFSNDASLLLPSTALDGEYMVLGWPQTIAISDDPNTDWGVNLRAFITIVGMQPNTSLSVTLTTPIVAGGMVPASNAGDTLTFNIGPYDVINLETGSFNADFTGTVVSASEPITVYSGSEASDVPYWTTIAERQCCADHMEEQLFPLSALGTQFVAVKTPSRTKYAILAGYSVALVPDEEEWWRVMATQPDTLVTTSLPPPNDHFTLQPGESMTWFTPSDFVVEASGAVAFGQFPGGQETTGIPIIDGQGAIPGGDPSFITVPPIQQWRSKYVFLIPDKYEFDSILLAMPSTSGILLDGDDVRQFTLGAAEDGGVSDPPRCEYDTAGTVTVPGGTATTTYVAIRCVLSDPRADDYGDPIYQNDGRHVVESTDGQPFGLIVRGWDNHVAYGYPGGADVRAVNPD